jgi:hypothetical protein
MDNYPIISLITTCKDRLAHLKTTLPSFVRQKNVETIVVDYGCTQGTSKFINDNFKDVKLIQVTDDPIFNVSRARNVGAKNARGRYLFFVDADVEIISSLYLWVNKNIKENTFFQFESSMGSVIIENKLFEKVGGYDEAFVGWGGEDRDFYFRLRLAGVKSELIKSDILRGIKHDNSIRQLSSSAGGMGDIETSLATTKIYMNVKEDIRRLTNNQITLEKRIQLMAYIKKQISNAKVTNDWESNSISIDISPFEFGGSSSSVYFSKKIIYTVKNIFE